MLSENDDVTRLQDHSIVISKMAERRLELASLLIAMIFSLLTLLEAHLILLRRHYNFSRREQNIRFL